MSVGLRTYNPGSSIGTQRKDSPGSALGSYRRALHPATGGEGFLLPYQQILKLAQGDPGSIPPRWLRLRRKSAGPSSSFASEHVTHDGAVASLLAAQTLAKIGRGCPWPLGPAVAWIDGELNRIWRLRGPFPGLGPLSKRWGSKPGT